MDIREKKLHDAITGISERYIEEAADMDGSAKNTGKPKFSRGFVRGMVTIAASFAIILLGAGALKMARVSIMDGDDMVATVMDAPTESARDMDESVAPGSAKDEVVVNSFDDEGSIAEEYAVASDKSAISESDSLEGSVPDAIEANGSKEVAEGAACIPAMGFALKPSSSDLAGIFGEESAEVKHNYKITLYGMISEEDLILTPPDGTKLENGYGELSLSKNFANLLETEAGRLTSLGIDAYVVCVDTDSEAYYELTANLTADELDSFPCSADYGYIIEPNAVVD